MSTLLNAIFYRVVDANQNFIPHYLEHSSQEKGSDTESSRPYMIKLRSVTTEFDEERSASKCPDSVAKDLAKHYVFTLEDDTLTLSYKKSKSSRSGKALFLKGCKISLVPVDIARYQFWMPQFPIKVHHMLSGYTIVICI